MNWKHFDIYFKKGIQDQMVVSANYKGKPTGVYKQLIAYFKKVVDYYGPHLNRFFFLFEDKPHIFLALEFKEKIKIEKSPIALPRFFASLEIVDSDDSTNGEHAVDMFHASAKFAFYRCSKAYEPKYLKCDENKLIHCFCNSNFVSWENEINFYLVGLLQRGVNAGLILNLAKQLKHTYDYKNWANKK